MNYSSARASPDAVPEEGMKAPELPGGGCCCGGDKPAEETDAKKWNVNFVSQKWN